MNKITIHTPHKNLELVKVAFEQLGIRDGKFNTNHDPSFCGAHLGARTECVIVNTSTTMSLDLLSRLNSFGMVEIEVSGSGSIGLDLN